MKKCHWTISVSVPPETGDYGSSYLTLVDEKLTTIEATVIAKKYNRQYQSKILAFKGKNKGKLMFEICPLGGITWHELGN